jgi:hypothetical protein
MPGWCHHKAGAAPAAAATSLYPEQCMLHAAGLHTTLLKLALASAQSSEADSSEAPKVAKECQQVLPLSLAVLTKVVTTKSPRVLVCWWC